MLKVTLVPALVYLNILLFNGCGEKHGTDAEEIRYENRLDTIYERKIDSAYARMGPACDSTLQVRWKILSDSILQRRAAADSSRHAAADSAGRPGPQPHPAGGL